jgi:hypothetical protein
METMDRAELKEIIGREPGGLFERIRTLGDDEDEKRRLIQEVWELSEGDEPKAMRKSAKKALYILRSKGIDVEVYRPKREARAREVREELRFMEPLLSVPDSFGTSRLIMPLIRAGDERIEVFQFAINRLKGVLNFAKSPVSKSFLKRLKASDPGIFPVPVDYALFRLRTALRKTDRGKISGLDDLPHVLEGDPGVNVSQMDVSHPVLSFVHSRVSRIHSPDEERRFLNIPEVGIMMLPDEDVRDYRERIEEARKSRLVIGNMTPEERVRDVVERFYMSYFTPERIFFFRERLFDIALSCYHRGMEDQAHLILSFAMRLAEPGESLKAHPLIQYLVYNSLISS